MSQLEDLISSAKELGILTVEATVDTGCETLAQEECREKFGSDVLILTSRGRVYFNIPISKFSSILTLRSVNNLFLILDYITDVNFSTHYDNVENQEVDLRTVGQLTKSVSWTKYLDLWKELTNFEGCLYPSLEEYQQVSHKDDESKTSNILRYRVTCYRSGKHTFGSQDAARSFGGELQDMFNWIVNLDDYQLEIVLAISNGNVRVMFAITEYSLHRRNISYYGLTTLRSTISFNLLQVAKPLVGDIVVDPFCGSGSIPIEGAVGMPGRFYLCGDKLDKYAKLTAKNVDAYYENYKKNLCINSLVWDVCSLPLRNSSVDVVATDLPFGKRVGSKANNRTLYPLAMQELARVVVPDTGRVVLLTSDKTSYSLSLQRNKIYWKQAKMLSIKMGNLKAFVFLLKRTRLQFVL